MKRRSAARPPSSAPADVLPDVRDGLTRLERLVLETLASCQRELEGRSVPTALLYGRLSERIDVSPEELVRVLARLARR
ncbi:MAG: hypothetical protein IAE78_23875 [Myxococcus sp.]|nr:hypothetical protein [Myxococcus sp.]